MNVRGSMWRTEKGDGGEKWLYTFQSGIGEKDETFFPWGHTRNLHVLFNGNILGFCIFSNLAMKSIFRLFYKFTINISRTTSTTFMIRNGFLGQGVKEDLSVRHHFSTSIPSVYCLSIKK